MGNVELITITELKIRKGNRCTLSLFKTKARL